jgi:hypothetical protein
MLSLQGLRCEPVQKNRGASLGAARHDHRSRARIVFATNRSCTRMRAGLKTGWDSSGRWRASGSRQTQFYAAPGESIECQSTGASATNVPFQGLRDFAGHLVNVPS